MDRTDPLVTLDGLTEIVAAVLFEQGDNCTQSIRCQLKAAHDLHAVAAWLDSYQRSAQTYRVYRKEVERFLLWCLYQKQLPLSALKRDAILDYQAFLFNPQPSAFWCGSKSAKRGSKNWRPFERGLTQSSAQKSLSILKSLFSFLVKMHYLHVNPVAYIESVPITTELTIARKLKVECRILHDDEWQAILHALEHLPEHTADDRFYKCRLRLIVHALFFLGLRVSELVSHCFGDFRKIHDQLWFYVRGKGNKMGKIPVNKQLQLTIAEYRACLQLPNEPLPDEIRPIIQHHKWNHPITARYVNILLKSLAKTAAKSFVGSPVKVAKLNQFSAHWLRHLSASMQDRAGVKFGYIRDNLRHSRDETTRIYVHTDDTERAAQMEKLTLFVGES
jgi:site-specific recombinase XerD